MKFRKTVYGVRNKFERLTALKLKKDNKLNMRVSDILIKTKRQIQNCLMSQIIYLEFSDSRYRLSLLEKR